MLRFNVIAFTHHTIGVDEIGEFHLDQDQTASKMQHLKEQLGIEEIMYVSTCNRVEFIFVTEKEVSEIFLGHFLNEFNPVWNQNALERLIENSKVWNGINAVNHLIEVASSLDSMVIGEREIIAQLKDAYDFAHQNQLSGDTIRIVMRQVIATAKKVYTETEIAAKPVSVVSLAYHQLVEKGLPLDARILFIGAGVTNTNMGRFLVKHGFTNFTVFNRSLDKGQILAKMLNCEAHLLSDISSHQSGFDLLVTCTGASKAIITNDIYKSLVKNETGKKIIIDLAVPGDLDKKVKDVFEVDLISVEFLKTLSDTNLKSRKRELIKVRHIIFEAVEEFKEIFKMRQVEVRMRSIPEKVKEIKNKALTEVFSKDLEQLDDNGLEIVEKILNYMEKKYISVPMIMAKEIIANRENQHED